MSIDEKAPGTRTTSKLLFECLPQRQLILDRCQKAVRGGVELVKGPERTLQKVQELLGPGVLSGYLRFGCYASICVHGVRTGVQLCELWYGSSKLLLGSASEVFFLSLTFSLEFGLWLGSI